MNNELIRMCGIDLESLKKSHFIVIREGLHHDGTFALAQFASYLLNNNGKIIFISLNQAKNHYVNILSKFGVKIKIFEENGHFVYIDGLKELSTFLFSKDNASSQEKYKINLRQLYENIQTSWTQISSANLKFIIIDDILTLESIGYPERLVANFITHLKILTSRTGGSLLTSVHSDSKDIAGSVLTMEMTHTADVMLAVDKLSTGYCSEIDGEVVCTKQDLTSIKPTTKQKMHYRLLPTGQVKYIAPGMSAAVL